MGEKDDLLKLSYGSIQRGINDIEQFLQTARNRRNELIKSGKFSSEFQAYDTVIDNIEEELGKFIEQLRNLRDDRIHKL